VTQFEEEATQQGVGESGIPGPGICSRRLGLRFGGPKSGGQGGAGIHGKNSTLGWGKRTGWRRQCSRGTPLRTVPAVTVHEVPNAGHHFVYESEAWAKKVLSDLLGLADAEEIAAKEAEAASAKYA